MAYWRESEPVGRDIRVSNTDLLDVAQDTTNSLEELGSGHSETSLGLPERLVENQKSLSEADASSKLGIHNWKSKPQIVNALKLDLSSFVRERPPVRPAAGGIFVYRKHPVFHTDGEPWQLDSHGWHVYSTAPSVHGVTTRHCEHRVGKGIYSRDFKLEDVILQEDIFKLNN
eukprot:867005_1